MSFTATSASNSGTTATVSVTISIPAGHTIAVAILDANQSTAGTLSDSGGNTYTLGSSATDGSRYIAMYYCLNPSSSITSVSYASTGTANTRFLMVWNCSGTGTISKADAKSVFFNFNAPNTTDGVTTGSLALTSSDGLLLGYAASFFSSALVAGTGFTSDGSFVANGSMYEHKAVSASGAVTWTTPSSGDYVLCTGLALQIASAASAPFIPIDLDERVTTKIIASDFLAPNLLADQVLKLPPFIQRELPGWLPKPAVVTDFHPPNLLADQILKPPPITQTDLLYKIQWKGVYTDFNPPNLLADQILKLPPFTQENDGARTFWRGVYTDFAPPNLVGSILVPVSPPLLALDLSQQVKARWFGSDFQPANLLTGILPLPPLAPVDATITIRAKGVFTDFSPPNLSLTTLVPPTAPLQPQDAFLRLEYRWIRGDDIPLNRLTLTQVAVTPLLPQDISGMRIEAKALGSDFSPPNLTLFLPIPPPPPVSTGAGRHGTRAQARKRRERDVLRAQIEAFKERRREAEVTLQAMEDREVTERAKVLKRVKVKSADLTRGPTKPVEQYAAVKRAISQRNDALSEYRSILAHLERAEQQAQELREQEDEEAALTLMHFLMWEAYE